MPPDERVDLASTLQAPEDPYRREEGRQVEHHVADDDERLDRRRQRHQGPGLRPVPELRVVHGVRRPVHDGVLPHEGRAADGHEQDRVLRVPSPQEGERHHDQHHGDDRSDLLRPPASASIRRSGVTGRGAPRTAGLAIRAATAPVRALWAMKMRARTTAHPRRAQPAAARSPFDQRGGRVGAGARHGLPAGHLHGSPLRAPRSARRDAPCRTPARAGAPPGNRPPPIPGASNCRRTGEYRWPLTQPATSSPARVPP